MVKKTSFTFGNCCRIRCAASRPFSSGIPISTTMTSGFSLAAAESERAAVRDSSNDSVAFFQKKPEALRKDGVIVSDQDLWPKVWH